MLRAPFPPIEILQWQTRMSDGCTKREPRWISFDNRRLCCLQRAAARHWPGLAVAVVRVLYDLPVERSAVRKMGRAASQGTRVSVARFHDDCPREWDWMEETRSASLSAEAVLPALQAIRAEARLLCRDLVDAPAAALSAATPGPWVPHSVAELFDFAARQQEATPGPWLPNSVAELFDLAARQQEEEEEADSSEMSFESPGIPGTAGQELLMVLRGGQPAPQLGLSHLGIPDKVRPPASARCAAQMGRQPRWWCPMEDQAQAVGGFHALDSGVGQRDKITADIWVALGRSPPM